MELNKIENKTLRQKVYELLKDKMAMADILPGQKISLRSLAAQLGVSLMPVREALWQLESEKTVVIESNKQMYVNSLTLEELDEILRIRLLLETMAVELACERRSEDALPKIKRLLIELHASMADTKDYLKKNQEFHFSIYALAESPILVDHISRLWARVGPYISLVARHRDDLLAAMNFHDPMYRALVERDKGKIVDSLQGDLITAADGMKQFIKRYGPDPGDIIEWLQNSKKDYTK
jgi:DNA-binding GntR family transcriptional regulator